MTTSESKGRFFYKTNRFESIPITNRIESIRIANWNALVTILELEYCWTVDTGQNYQMSEYLIALVDIMLLLRYCYSLLVIMVMLLCTLCLKKQHAIQGGPKKWGHRLMAIILSNLKWRWWLIPPARITHGLCSGRFLAFFSAFSASPHIQQSARSKEASQRSQRLNVDVAITQAVSLPCYQLTDY